MKQRRAAESKNAHDSEDIVAAPNEGTDDGKHQQFSAKFDLWTCHGARSETRNRRRGKRKHAVAAALPLF